MYTKVISECCIQYIMHQYTLYINVLQKEKTTFTIFWSLVYLQPQHSENRCGSEPRSTDCQVAHGSAAQGS